jgi:hypothetical protein
MLYDKTLSIKPINYPSPSCKDCPDFFPLFALSIYKGPLNKDWLMYFYPLGQGPPLLWVVTFPHFQ